MRTETITVGGVVGVASYSDKNHTQLVTKLRSPPESRQPSDEILIRSFVTSGDEEIFVTLVERYAKQIRGILYALLNGSVEDIYDVEQEVMINLFRSLRRFAFRSRFSSYLYRLCTNVAINYLRGLKRSQQTVRHLQQQALVRQGAPEELSERLEHQEEWRHFQKVFTKLNERDKTIIQLRIFEERPVPECATILQIAEGSVKSRLNRARSRLTLLLSHEKGDTGNHG